MLMILMLTVAVAAAGASKMEHEDEPPTDELELELELMHPGEEVEEIRMMKEEEKAIPENGLRQQQSTCNSSGTVCQTRYWGTCQPHNYTSYYWCDYSLDGVCQNSDCKCCLQCARDINSQCGEEAGTCRKSCYHNEYQELCTACSSTCCGCCKKCQTGKGCTPGYPHYGRCVGNYLLGYTSRSYYLDWSARCLPDKYGRNRCYCIKFCNTYNTCKKAGGFCARYCPMGYKEYRCGCSSKYCRCCVRETSTAVPVC